MQIPPPYQMKHIYTFLNLLMFRVLFSADMIANITDEKLADEIRNLNSQNLKYNNDKRKLSIKQASQFLHQKAKILQAT